MELFSDFVVEQQSLADVVAVVRETADFNVFVLGGGEHFDANPARLCLAELVGGIVDYVEGMVESLEDFDQNLNLFAHDVVESVSVGCGDERLAASGLHSFVQILMIKVVPCVILFPRADVFKRKQRRKGRQFREEREVTQERSTTSEMQEVQLVLYIVFLEQEQFLDVHAGAFSDYAAREVWVAEVDESFFSVHIEQLHRKEKIELGSFAFHVVARGVVELNQLVGDSRTDLRFVVFETVNHFFAILWRSLVDEVGEGEVIVYESVFEVVRVLLELLEIFSHLKKETISMSL